MVKVACRPSDSIIRILHVLLALYTPKITSPNIRRWMKRIDTWRHGKRIYLTTGVRLILQH